jgi:hypothetical protein
MTGDEFAGLLNEFAREKQGLKASTDNNALSRRR